MEPDFSIIIPSYNREATLGRAIESVLSQTFPAREIIVVDDGSTDETAELVKNFPTIKYFHQENRGVTSARNKGAEEATGDWLIFLDSDDELVRKALNEFASMIRCTPDQPFFKCGYIVKDLAKGKLIEKPLKIGVYSAPIPGSFFLTKSIFRKVGGYNENLSYSENTELFYKLSSIGVKPFVFEFMSMIYNQSHSGGSKNLKNMDQSLQLILNLHSNAMSLNEKWNLHQTLGVIQLRRGKFSEARETFLIAIQSRPFKFSTYLRFLIGCFPIISRKIYSSNFYSS